MKEHLVIDLLVLLLLTSLIGCAPSATPAPAAAVDAEVKAETTATPALAQAEGRWEVMLETEIEQPVRMGAFLNETFGVTGGATGAGRAHYTTDGGQTWTKADSSGGCLYGVDIVDDQTVWVCGRMTGQSFSTPGGVRLSVDGGQTWEEQTTYQTTPGFCPLSFLDTKVGWVANAGKLSATADGGVTWEELILPDSISEIVAISLRTPSEGHVLDYAGNLYTTRDGGESWSSQPLGLEKYGELKVLLPTNTAIAAMRFYDADQGVVVLNLAGGGERKVVALRTVDGGQTWDEESVPSEIGIPYLTHDGRLLTICELLNTSSAKLLRYRAD
jgi:hypothetical protein